MATFAEQIGAKIRIHRIAKNWTQEQLAEFSNTTASYIGQLERGEKDARMSTIEKIVNALDISIFELFNDEGKEALLMEKKWVWASILLLLKHDEQKQHQAYRILQVLLASSEENS